MNTPYHTLFSAKLNCLDSRVKFINSIKNNNIKQVKKFLEFKWINDINNRYFLKLAVENNNIEIVKILLSTCIYGNIWSIYSHAVKMKYEKICELLKDQDITKPPNKRKLKWLSKLYDKYGDF